MNNNNPQIILLINSIFRYLFSHLNIYCECDGQNMGSIPLYLLSYLLSLMTVFRAFAKSSEVISRTFKDTPAPRVSMRFALSIWSPNKGIMTIGTPLQIPSYTPWEPECVIKARVFGWPEKKKGGTLVVKSLSFTIWHCLGSESPLRTQCYPQLALAEVCRRKCALRCPTG